MLLARQRPLAARPAKRLPAESAKAPKPRGFGARRKLAAAPLKAGRAVPVEQDTAIVDSAAEPAMPGDWASNVDWVGVAGESVAPRPNGHAPRDAEAKLLVPDAIAAPAPELRTLN